MEFLLAIEQLGPARALKASFYAYPLVNAVHILSIGALLTSVILMDLRIFGLFPAQDRKPFLRLMRRVALTAFAGAVATGIPMFAIRASEYAFNPAFRLKMLLIALAVANLTALQFLASGPDGTPADRGRTRVFAALSMMLWISVAISGRFIGFL